MTLYKSIWVFFFLKMFYDNYVDYNFLVKAQRHKKSTENCISIAGMYYTTVMLVNAILIRQLKNLF